VENSEHRTDRTDSDLAVDTHPGTTQETTSGNTQNSPEMPPVLVGLARDVREMRRSGIAQFWWTIVISFLLAGVGVYLSITYSIQSDKSFHRMESLSTPLLYDGVRRLADSLGFDFSTVRDPLGIAALWTAFLRNDHRGFAKLSKQYFHRFPRDANVYFVVALDELNKGDTGRAIVLLDTAIMLRPDFASALNNRAVVKMALDSLSSALSDLELAIRVNPTYVFALNNKGDCLRRLGRYVEAESACARACTLDTADAVLPYGLALVLGAEGKYAEADSAVSVAIQRNPTFADARAERANIRIAELPGPKGTADPSQLAAQDIDYAVSLNPSNAKYYCIRGRLQNWKHNRSAAADDFRTAIRLDSTLGYAHYWLAVSYDASGKRDSAALHYAAALQHPSLMESREILHARERHAVLVNGEIRVFPGTR
jgi:tetratricopeptide (TPR) repeat protein